jgi:hypothetical protein
MMESLDSLDPPLIFTAVFSTQEKAFASLVDFCKREWDDMELPANDDDIVTQYFEDWGDRDYGWERSVSIKATMSGLGVRRDKAAFSSGCKPHPATAPAGSNRSSHGGNEVAEAFD